MGIKQEEDKDDACDESLPPEPRKDKATGGLEYFDSKENTEEQRNIQLKIEDTPKDDDERETNCSSDDPDDQDKMRQIQELVERVEKKKQRLEDCRHVRKKKDKKRKEAKRKKRGKKKKKKKKKKS